VKILVKLGGTLLDSAESRQRLVREIKEAMVSGVQIVVVHGGGKQMTRFLAERGIESRFVNGLRVTTDDVLDAVLKVFAGTVNHELVGAFVAAGISAVGLSGMDGALIEAEPLDPALGHVGKPVRCDARLLNLLCANTYLPVVACVGGDPRGRYYNVNADQMAVACAVAFQADKVLFLTDVDGVRDADKKVCSTLTQGECEALIRSEVATGGMHAKLNAAVDAVHRGVAKVIIAPGSLDGVINLILSGQIIGTTIVSEHLQAAQ
jgi:acetylglutamate kinase